MYETQVVKLLCPVFQFTAALEMVVMIVFFSDRRNAQYVYAQLNRRLIQYWFAFRFYKCHLSVFIQCWPISSKCKYSMIASMFGNISFDIWNAKVKCMFQTHIADGNIKNDSKCERNKRKFADDPSTDTLNDIWKCSVFAETKSHKKYVRWCCIWIEQIFCGCVLCVLTIIRVNGH